jgi:hypothetical protein
VSAAAARYPEGAKLLRGADRSYVVAPLMNIVEEKYTAYFEFTQPGAASAAVGGVGAQANATLQGSSSRRRAISAA